MIVHKIIQRIVRFLLSQLDDHLVFDPARRGIFENIVKRKNKQKYRTMYMMRDIFLLRVISPPMLGNVRCTQKESSAGNSPRNSGQLYHLRLDAIFLERLKLLSTHSLAMVVFKTVLPFIKCLKIFNESWKVHKMR